MSGAAAPRPLRFPVRGRALAPRLLLEPRLLHFGAVEAGGWGDQLVTMTNGCDELPLRVAVDKGSPYFQVCVVCSVFSCPQAACSCACTSR